MNGRNRLYDDDLLTMIDIKAQLQGNFRVKKRDEDIRLIPKSSNIGSSKYKPVLTRVEENENKRYTLIKEKRVL